MKTYEQTASRNLNDNKKCYFKWRHVSVDRMQDRALKLHTHVSYRNSLSFVRRGSSVSIVAKLRAGQPGFDSRQEQRPFSLRHRVQIRSGDHPPSLLSNGYRGLFPRVIGGRGVKLTTHLHPAPKLRMCGAILLLLHTSSWNGT
jgi:hypothetical protein